MQYQVPQFIEIEDKVIGPLTVKQFVYLAGGAGMAFIAYRFLFIYLAIPVIAVIILLSLALAFYKVNNKGFIDFLESAFLYYTKNNLYIWKKEVKKIVPKTVEEQDAAQVFVPRLSDSKLKELSWSLDVNKNQDPLAGSGGRGSR